MNFASRKSLLNIEVLLFDKHILFILNEPLDVRRSSCVVRLTSSTVASNDIKRPHLDGHMFFPNLKRENKKNILV